MKKILIIDDDMDMCKLLSHFLQRKGFETDTAYNGNKGLAKFKEESFDVVLCDFRLGDMDGVKVLTGIREINPSALVIIITGYSDIKMAVEVMRQGAFDYITKPLIPEEVINVINKGLAAGGTSDKNEAGGSKTGTYSFRFRFVEFVYRSGKQKTYFLNIQLQSDEYYCVVRSGSA